MGAPMSVCLSVSLFHSHMGRNGTVLIDPSGGSGVSGIVVDVLPSNELPARLPFYPSASQPCDNASIDRCVCLSVCLSARLSVLLPGWAGCLGECVCARMSQV
uniref:Uncharacterized protein n=1 Tax=Vitrella brassicaformis TaxID=1169539 RepID=A0A7S1KCL8_9ALVE